MKTRIVTAAICIPVLLFLLLVAPEIIVTVIFGVLMAVGAYEFLYRTGLVRRPRMVAYSALAAFMLSIWSYYGGLTSFLMLGLIVFFMLLFSEVMMDHVKVPIELVGLCTLGGFLIPFLLSALIRILMGTNGRYFILLPFTIAFLSDAGAYFVGLRLGRHKLAPAVSPKKTVEGSIGGLAGGMLGIKPLITLQEGKVAMAGKARGLPGAYVALFKKIEELGGINPSFAALAGYTLSTREVAPIQTYLRDNLQQEDPLVRQIGCVIGTHAGPGAFGLAFFDKDLVLDL